MTRRTHRGLYGAVTLAPALGSFRGILSESQKRRREILLTNNIEGYCKNSRIFECVIHLRGNYRFIEFMLPHEKKKTLYSLFASRIARRMKMSREMEVARIKVDNDFRWIPDLFFEEIESQRVGRPHLNVPLLARPTW